MNRRTAINGPHNGDRCQQRRRGLSLLEVLLALGILAVAVSLLAELLQVGARSGRSARESTRAQLLCEAKMNELAAGVEPLSSVSQGAFADAADWRYSVHVSPAPEAGLLEVRVVVQNSTADRPISAELTRWILDTSDARFAEEEEEQQEETPSGS